MQAVILIGARCVSFLGCDGYGRSYDGYVPLHKLTSNFLYVGGWLVPLGPPGGGFKPMCPPQFSPTPPLPHTNKNFPPTSSKQCKSVWLRK